METVCVTGASGFVASWLVKRLLDKGYKVRGTVRDPGNAEKVAHLLALPGAAERLELFKADLSEEGTFVEAIKGCNGVFHVASPVSFHKTDDPEGDFIIPAVQGTLDVLKACLNEPSVKRVVYTSSIATIRAKKGLPPDHVFTEEDWSDVGYCRQGSLWYPLSKTLAEQAAWDFASKNQIDLVSVLPSMILGGPCLPAVLTASLAHFLKILKGDLDFFNKYYSRASIVHIDDVVTAHILVYESPSASGRYICSAQDVSNKEAVTTFTERYPGIFKTFDLSQLVEPTFNGLDNSKIVNLGLKFKSKEVTFDDGVEVFRERGLV